MKAECGCEAKPSVLPGRGTSEAAGCESIAFLRRGLAFAGVAEIELRAADGVVLVADPATTEEQLMQLDQWRADNEEHARVFRELFDKWCGTGPLGARERAVATSREEPGRPRQSERKGSAIDAAMVWRDLIFQNLLFRIEGRSATTELLQETYRSFVLLDTTDLEYPQSILACLVCLSRSVAEAYLREVEESPDLREQWGLPVDVGLAASKAARSPLARAVDALERLPQLPKHQREILALSIAHHCTEKGVARKLVSSGASVREGMESAVRTIREVIRANGGVEES